MNQSYFDDVDENDDGVNISSSNNYVENSSDSLSSNSKSYFDDDDDDVSSQSKQNRKINNKDDKKQKKTNKKVVAKYKKKKRKKAFSGQTALGLFCIMCGLLVYFVIGPFLNGVIGNSVDIARVSTTIQPGDQITADDIEVVTVNKGSIPDGAVITSEDIIDKFSTSKLVAGDFFMSAKLEDSIFGDGVYMNGLTGDERIVSITIPGFAEGLSAKIKAGDIITFEATPEDGTLVAETFPELMYVKVLAATTSDGIDVVDGEDDSPELPTTLTLLVNDAQAKLLIGLNSSGRLHTVLVYRGESDIADQFLEEQDAYFN